MMKENMIISGFRKFLPIGGNRCQILISDLFNILVTNQDAIPLFSLSLFAIEMKTLNGIRGLSGLERRSQGGRHSRGGGRRSYLF